MKVVAAVLDPRYTVLICDDRSELRAAITTVLSNVPNFQVVGEAIDGASCLDQVRQTHPDLLILDIGMPGGGPGVATAARALHPDLHILVFSGINDPQVQNTMLCAGADEYVVKTGRLRPLLEALNRAIQNRTTTTVQQSITPDKNVDPP